MSILTGGEYVRISISILCLAVFLLPLSAAGAPLRQTCDTFSASPNGSLYETPDINTSSWSFFSFYSDIEVTWTDSLGGFGTLPGRTEQSFPPGPIYAFSTSIPFDYTVCYEVGPTPTPTLTSTPTSVSVVTATPTATPTITPTLTPEQALVEVQIYALAWQIFVGLSLMIAAGLLVLRVRM